MSTQNHCLGRRSLIYKQRAGQSVCSYCNLRRHACRYWNHDQSVKDSSANSKPGDPPSGISDRDKKTRKFSNETSETLSPLLYGPASVDSDDDDIFIRRRRRIKKKVKQGGESRSNFHDGTAWNEKHGPRERADFTTAKGPCAIDDFRCELRPVGMTPSLRNPVIRILGELPIRTLAKFVLAKLGLKSSERICIRCCGEDLDDSMTLRQLVTYAWRDEGCPVALSYESQGTVG